MSVLVQKDRCKWIYDIIDGKVNQQYVIYNHESFIIISDKLSYMDVKDVHLIAFVKTKKLRTIKDIRRRHISLITAIRDTGIKYLHNKYQFNIVNINTYFNYPPGTYLLHIHFAYKNSKCDLNTRHYNVDTVIHNITQNEYYYDNITSASSIQSKNKRVASSVKQKTNFIKQDQSTSNKQTILLIKRKQSSLGEQNKSSQIDKCSIKQDQSSSSDQDKLNILSDVRQRIFNVSTIVVRKNILADIYGAYLLFIYRGCKIILTNQDNIPDVKIRDLNSLLIVGGHYGKNYNMFKHNITVFINENEDIPAYDHIKFIRTREESGFATWVLTELGIEHKLEYNIAKMLDGYMYNPQPEELYIYLYNGIYDLPGSTLLDKISHVTHDNFDNILESGKRQRLHNKHIAKKRACGAVKIKVKYDEKDIDACAVMGDNVIFDTCLSLISEHSSGVAITYYQNLNERKTHLFIRTTKQSGVNAGKLANQLYNGRGTTYIGTCTANELITPIRA